MKEEAVEPYLHDFSTFRGKQLPQVWEDSGYFKKRKCHQQKQELIFDSIYSLKKSTEKCIPYNARPLAPLSFLPSVLPCCPEGCSPSSRYRKTITPTWMSSSHEPQIYSSSNFSVTSKCPLHLLGFSGPHALKSCLLLCM